MRKVWSAVAVELCVDIGKQMSLKTRIFGKVDSANHVTGAVLIQENRKHATNIPQEWSHDIP